MKDIKNYLEKQAEISKDLNDILLALNTIETSENERLYKENQELIEKINSLNKSNLSASKNKLDYIKDKIRSMLLEDETDKDPNFKKYLLNLDSEVNSIIDRINYLNDNLNKMGEIHYDYINKLENHNTDTLVQKNISTQKDITQSLDNNKLNLNKANTNKSNRSKQSAMDEDKKLELNIGSNALNILGVVLILIGFITFGNHIYTYYMNDLTKGIFLFVVSSLILGLGEKVFYKKNPKFSIGISALGVGCLYASLIINYLVLDNLNSIFAILLTLIITALSIFISSKHNSNIIRVIGLIGGYGCLMPMEYLGVTQSYITIIMLLIITLFNVYIPMKNSNFTVYSSVLTSIFGTFLRGTSFLDDSALMLFVLVNIIVNNFMYIKLCDKEGYNNKHHLSLFLTTMYLMILSPIHNDILIVGLILMVISIISYCYSNIKIKSAFYCHTIFIGCSLMFGYLTDFELIYHLLFISVIGITLYLTVIHTDIYMIIASILVCLFGFGEFITEESILISILYFAIFATSVWKLSKNYKDSILVIFLKHTSFACTILSIWFNTPFDIDKTMLFTNFLTLVYLLTLSNVPRLRDDNFKLINKCFLLITIASSSMFGWLGMLNVLISLILNGISLLILTNEEYVEDEFIKKHKMLIYSIFSTYVSCTFSLNVGTSFDISNFILSVILIFIAFINVWIGFKLNISEVRKYGLILSLIVCCKVILVDFYSYNFVVKAGLFLIIGIVAVTISYIYSKLERELKMKDNNSTDDEYNIEDLKNL